MFWFKKSKEKSKKADDKKDIKEEVKVEQPAKDVKPTKDATTKRTTETKSKKVTETKNTKTAETKKTTKTSINKTAKKGATTKSPVKVSNAKKPADKQASTKRSTTKISSKQEEKLGAYRVMYDKEDRLWKIKRDGAKRVITSMPTKEEALKRVDELSESQDVRVVVHKKDGKFQKR